MLPSQNVQRRFQAAPTASLRRRHPWRRRWFHWRAWSNLSALGYRIVEGWDWGDSYWMVLITISTIGTAGEIPFTAAVAP